MTATKVLNTMMHMCKCCIVSPRRSNYRRYRSVDDIILLSGPLDLPLGSYVWSMYAYNSDMHINGGMVYPIVYHTANDTQAVYRDITADRLPSARSILCVILGGDLRKLGTSAASLEASSSCISACPQE